MTYTITKKSEDLDKTEESVLSEHEQVIKTELESWIADIYKHVELEQRLKKAFERDKSHTRSLSEL